MITFRHLLAAFRELGIDHARPLIAHASLSAFGSVQDGPEAFLGALLYCFDSLMMPGFTYKTMIVPEVGPPHNGITYCSRDSNRMAEFYHPKMPVDRIIGVIPEALRRHPRSRRSMHPILSFVGVNAGRFLDAQTITEPLAPIEALTDSGGWVLLLGVDHTVNTSLHYAERLAGRKQFLRWALIRDGVVETPGFPGCSDAFDAIAPRLATLARWTRLGDTLLQAFPLAEMVATAREWIEAEPLALLCERPDCERCMEVRRHVQEMAITL